VHQTRRPDRGVRARLPLLHHHQAPQPPLPARDLRQSHPPQLHDHGRGPRRPTPRHRGRQRAARTRGGKERPHHPVRLQQEAAQRDRGQDPGGPFLIRGQHPGGRNRHQSPLLLQDPLQRNLRKTGIVLRVLVINGK
jgi:hypothetical protein